MSLILQSVTKSFPQRGGQGLVTAVDNVSLTINKGEFVTLLGPSGCGKTTTLRLIAGFESPTSGSIRLDDQDVTYQPPNKRDMAMVFQSYALFPHMSVFDNIAYGLQTHKVPANEVKQRVEKVLDMMSLTGLAARRPNQLSGGQQQRVALARCLVMEPSVLLFDEPLSNLDAKLRVQMRSEIHQLQRRLNITSVYVTHDQTEAMSLSDRIVVMNKGQIEQIGSPKDIYRKPVSRFVADFIGRANFVNAHVEATNGDNVTLSILGLQMQAKAPGKVSKGDQLTAVIRPEGVLLRQDPSLPQAEIEQAMYLGSTIEYIARIGDLRLIVVEPEPQEAQIFLEGQRTGLTLKIDTVHLLPQG